MYFNYNLDVSIFCIKFNYPSDRPEVSKPSVRTDVEAQQIQDKKY